MRDQVEKTKSGSPSPSMSPAAIALATSVSSAVPAFSGTAAANGLCRADRQGLPPVLTYNKLPIPARHRGWLFAAVATRSRSPSPSTSISRHAARVLLFGSHASSAIAAPNTRCSASVVVLR